MRPLLFFLSLFSLNSFSQSIDPDQLRDILAEGSKGQSSKTEQFESFTQNNYSNTLKLIEQLDKDSERELFYSSLTQKRIELASQLCAKDKRACILIDQYREFNEDLQNDADSSQLKLFGLDIFLGYPINLDAFVEQPLSDSYRLKIGDNVKVQISGIENFSNDIQIDPLGYIALDQFGAFKVSGLTVSEARDFITAEILNSYTGSKIYIGLTSLNPKNIFVLGNVINPGSYGVNAFSTAINALITGGGIKNNSSLRNISVKSNGVTKKLDLYDFLIDGDLSSDLMLQDGDSVLVMGLENQVSITGAVNRPAIYEFIEGETINDLLKFALGFSLGADTKSVTIKRRDDIGNNNVIRVTSSNFDNFKLAKADEVIVNKFSGNINNGLEIIGAIRNPGTYFLDTNANLAQFINLQTDLLDDTYTPLSIIRRFDAVTRSWKYIKFDLLHDLSSITLKDKDQVLILRKQDIEFLNSSPVMRRFVNNDDQSVERSNFSQSTLNTIQAVDTSKIDDNISNQSKLVGNFSCVNEFSQPVKIVEDLIELKFLALKSEENDVAKECTTIFSNIPNLIPYLLANSVPLVGNVQTQALYPVSEKINGEQLFNYAGGSILSPTNQIFFEVLYNKGSVVANTESISSYSNLEFINAKVNINDVNQGFVSVIGEVNFPGEYAIRAGDTLASIYRRAGGLTPFAYPRGGVLTREAIQLEEKRVLLKAQKDLGEVISNAALNGYLNQNPTDLVQLISLISSLSESEALGRLVTEMDPNLLSSNPEKDIMLQPGDKIYIPKINNTVTVFGNVLNPITVPYQASFNSYDYIRLAGGFNESADKSRAYVIYPNGASERIRGGILNLFGENILPGSTIIVPRKANSDNLAIVKLITPVLADLSVTAASINAISN